MAELNVLMRPGARTVIVSIEGSPPSHVQGGAVITWGETFTGSTSGIEAIEFDEFLTTDELQAAAEGEAEIDRGEYVTLGQLENTLKE